eukprot:GHVP01021603.1.p1 GENE.GHVP01021603.1~~GHVP01021603.1.p1  ORF type:complete len:760 (-),score=131.55 GHVP01021603.1:2071-4350(-)
MDAVTNHFRNQCRSSILDSLANIKATKLLLISEDLVGPVAHLLESTELSERAVVDWKTIDASLEAKNLFSSSSKFEAVVFLLKCFPSHVTRICTSAISLFAKSTNGKANSWTSFHNSIKSSEGVISRSTVQIFFFFIPEIRNLNKEIIDQDLRLSLGYSVKECSNFTDVVSNTNENSEDHKGIVHLVTLPLRFLPVAEDVIVTNDPHSLCSFYHEKDLALASQFAKSLFYLQKKIACHNGCEERIFTNIKALGKYPRFIAETIIKYRGGPNQTKLPKETVNKQSTEADYLTTQIEDSIYFDLTRLIESAEPRFQDFKQDADENEIEDSENNFGIPQDVEFPILIILDRKLDLITPLCTPSSYEALLAQYCDYKWGSVVLPSTGDEASQNQKGQIVKLVSSTDSLFATLRDMHVSQVGPHLKSYAAHIDKVYKEKDDLKTVSEISAYVPKFKVVQSQHTSLARNINLTSHIMKSSKKEKIVQRIRLEDEIVAGAGNTKFSDSLLESLDLMFDLEESPEEIYRILCLLSVINGGLKQKAEEHFKPLFVQRFGVQEIVRMRKLEAMGLLRSSSNSNSLSSWNNIFNSFNLLVTQEEKTDAVTSVFSGYVPLTIRLVQLLDPFPAGWRANINLISQLGETPFEGTQRHASRKKISPSTPELPNKPINFAVLCFLGGITWAEIAAIRKLRTINEHSPFFLVVSNEILNPKDFLSPPLVVRMPETQRLAATEGEKLTRQPAQIPDPNQTKSTIFPDFLSGVFRRK